MSTFTKSLSGLLSASALAIGLAVIAQPAAAAIKGSIHDFSKVNDLGTITGANTTQICVFCHTPHGASTANSSAPLWNKTVSAVGTSPTFTLYGSATYDGAATEVGNISLACLSCHDGAQAANNMLNKPGSGGGTGDGVSATRLDTAVNGNLSGIIALGTNLSNDHPIGMNYCAAADDATLAALTTCRDDGFFEARVEGSETSRFWVDTEGTAGVTTSGNGTFEKTDFPLYSNSALGGAGGRVECATCHDVHGTANGTLLRIANTGSSVCLTCHVK